MLAKMTSKNQLTLPKLALQELGPVEYFDVEVRAGQIVLTPVRILRGDAVRAKLAALGLGQADVGDAVRWARAGGSVPAVSEPAATYRAPKAASKRAAASKKPARRA